MGLSGCSCLECHKQWQTAVLSLRRCCVCVIAARVVITQGASLNLNLFSSREAEYEQRAQLLKRLSFTIYCSEIDQYQRHMPDIQGTLIVCSAVGCCTYGTSCDFYSQDLKVAAYVRVHIIMLDVLHVVVIIAVLRW